VSDKYTEMYQQCRDEAAKHNVEYILPKSEEPKVSDPNTCRVEMRYEKLWLPIVTAFDTILGVHYVIDREPLTMGERVHDGGFFVSTVIPLKLNDLVEITNDSRGVVVTLLERAPVNVGFGTFDMPLSNCLKEDKLGPEALDRAYLVQSMFELMFTEHEYIDKHQDLKKSADELTAKLAEFYSQIGHHVGTTDPASRFNYFAKVVEDTMRPKKEECVAESVPVDTLDQLPFTALHIDSNLLKESVVIRGHKAVRPVRGCNSNLGVAGPTEVNFDYRVYFSRERLVLARVFPDSKEARAIAVDMTQDRYDIAQRLFRTCMPVHSDAYRKELQETLESLIETFGEIKW